MNGNGNGYVNPVLELIREKGPIRSTAIAQRLNMDLKYVTNSIRSLRKSFNNGNSDEYIYLTKDGYTLRESKHGVVYETNMRLSQMIGMGINSTFIRTRCKRIALKDFRKLRMVYRPGLLLLENEMK